MSVIEALYSGKILPWERRNPHSAEQLVIEEKIKSEKGYLIERLPPCDCKRLETLDSLYSSMSQLEQLENYTHGFALGALLMMEAAAKKEAIIDG